MPKGVYERKIKPVPPKITPRPASERFWAKVEKTDGCWLWRGAVDGRGYGKLQVGTLKKPRLVTTHRFAYEEAYGPTTLNVLHRCDVRLCVRPDHLYAGTQATNQRDMAEKGRSTWGERAANHKLTEEIVKELRHLHDEGLLNQAGAARKYGVSQATVSKIVRRKGWTQLQD